MSTEHIIITMLVSVLSWFGGAFVSRNAAGKRLNELDRTVVAQGRDIKTAFCSIDETQRSIGYVP